MTEKSLAAVVEVVIEQKLLGVEPTPVASVAKRTNARSMKQPCNAFIIEDDIIIMSGVVVAEVVVLMLSVRSEGEELIAASTFRPVLHLPKHNGCI